MRKSISILVVCAVAVSAMAVPARRGGMVRTAEDGTEKMVFLNGDEFLHYMTDANGNWLDEETLMPLSAEQKAQRMQVKDDRAKARRAPQETGTARLLSPRGAIILVSYADKAFKSSHEDMTEWAMGDNYTYNGATGSIHQYFIDQSWGQYDLQIDVIGPVTVSRNLAYYGSNDTSGNDKHADDLVVEACKIAHDSLGVDFSQYDSNNDGEVDWVVVIYAGKGEADGGATNTIWPHQYDLAYTGKDFKLDGKWINHYCCLSEQDGQTGKRNGIGTFCHEFSHVMGLPDFYATNDASHHTLCDWDLMDYGPYNNDGNTPPNYSAYERWFMGWFQPRLVNEAASVILPPLHESMGAVYMTAMGEAIDDILIPNPKTFYMFENRQQTGWDTYIAGSGLLITKVQWSAYKWEGNTVNNSASNMGVDIMEAKANTTSRARNTDLYPAGATEFTQIVSYQVTNIAMDKQIVTFDVNGGGADINLDVENVQPAAIGAQKILRDGKVVIIRDGQEFDLLGNRL